MKDSPKTNIQTLDSLVFAPINEETLRQHLAQMVKAKSLKELTLAQRKKYASKHIYLIRYE